MAATKYLYGCDEHALEIATMGIKNGTHLLLSSRTVKMTAGTCIPLHQSAQENSDQRS